MANFLNFEPRLEFLKELLGGKWISMLCNEAPQGAHLKSTWLEMMGEYLGGFMVI